MGFIMVSYNLVNYKLVKEWGLWPHFFSLTNNELYPGFINPFHG